MKQERRRTKSRMLWPWAAVVVALFGAGTLWWWKQIRTVPMPAEEAARISSNGLAATDSAIPNNAPPSGLLHSLEQREAFVAWLMGLTDASEIMNFGFGYLSAGQWLEAIGCFHRALELKQDDEEVHFNLAYAYTRIGRTDDAVRHYEQALQIHPEYTEAHINLGNLLTQMKRYPEAMEHYSSALQLSPEHAGALNNLGRVLAETGQPREALARFQEALRLDPDHVDAHFNLGNAYLAIRQTNEAVAQFQEVLKRRPGFAPARQLLDRIQAAPR